MRRAAFATRAARLGWFLRVRAASVRIRNTNFESDHGARWDGLAHLRYLVDDHADRAWYVPSAKKYLWDEVCLTSLILGGGQLHAHQLWDFRFRGLFGFAHVSGNAETDNAAER